MERITFRVYKRPYIVFGIMFGGVPMLLILVGFFLKGSLNIKQDLIFLSLCLIPLILTYAIFSIYKVTYDNKQIKYRGLFGTKVVNIDDIKNYQIKSTLGTISTKPIFGLFKLTINDPRRPTFGLLISTIGKKTDMIIPAKLFSADDLNNLMEHIDKMGTNLTKSKRSKAGKSVLTYLK